MAAIASVPVAMTTLGNNGVTLPGASSAARLMAMLDARSPGERTQGNLAQSKIKGDLASSPRQRALGKTFPPKPSPMEQLARVVVPTPPPAIVDAIPPVVPGAPLTPAIADVISPAGLIANAPLAIGSAIIGGSIGGSGPSTPISVAPPTVEPVVTAVPEPGTWVMMLFGFGAVGMAMRRRSRPALAH